MIKRNPKILIPNFFTSLNMIIGMTAIFYSIKGDYVNAGWLILLGGIMDKLDGTAARFFKVSTGFGVEFDSFSDFVSFAFAPALLVFSYFSAKGHTDLSGPGFYIIVACAVYVLFSAIRLAKYNSMQSEDKNFFYGLTTTQSGGMIAAYMVFAVDNDLSFLLEVNLVAGMVIAQAFLLLVPFKYPKIQKPESRMHQFLMVIGFVVFVMLILVRKLPWLIYIVGVLVVLVGTYRSRKVIIDFDEEDDTEPEKKE
jgi:CDP-diacylglycerol--serine O-phosphatidyltransferase